MLCLRLFRPEWKLVLPSALQAAIAQNEAALQTTVQSSKLHLDVSHVLKQMGVEHVNEEQCGGLSVDIVVTAAAFADRKVVLEMDGPSHYFRSHPRKPDTVSHFSRGGCWRRRVGSA